VLGCAPSGVIAYNCNYENIPEPADGEVVDILTYAKDARGKLAYSGMKWQCVEYARRWWVSQFDLYLLNVPRACDIWTRTFVRRLSDNKNVAIKMHDNGTSTVKPAVGDFLIWKRTDEQPVGHIAVVSELTDTHVRIAEQNVDNNVMWGGGHYSRQFALQRSEETGAWTIRDDEDPMHGYRPAANNYLIQFELSQMKYREIGIASICLPQFMIICLNVFALLIMLHSICLDRFELA
jgi:glutathionylspermidine amidase/synthetase